MNHSASPAHIDAPVMSNHQAGALPQQRASALVGHTYGELAELFEDLPAPRIESELRLRGMITTFMGTSWMPRPLRWAIARVLGIVLPWSAKEFRGNQGSNIWFGFRRGIRFLHYEISQQAGVDGMPTVWLSYDVPRNLALFRRIRGEVRMLGPRLLLCRMQWKTRNRYFTVMYFTLGQA
jgi:hypothetical protein